MAQSIQQPAPSKICQRQQSQVLLLGAFSSLRSFDEKNVPSLFSVAIVSVLVHIMFYK